jgi:ribonuclease HIII
MSTSCFVCTIDLSIVQKLKEDLKNQGFSFTAQDHTIFCAKKQGVTAVLYTSGKLVVQGKEMKPFIEFYLEPEILHSLDFSHPHANADKTERIGVDEAGKGDYFGPLSIGAVYIQANQFDELIKLGIKDSKKIQDDLILKMAEKINQICQVESIVIFPQKYNELYQQFKNLNYLLAWGHSKAIENLHAKTGCHKVILDQFAASKSVIDQAISRKGLKLDVHQMHKAEQDLAVAAASIVARAGFLNGLKKLQTQYQIDFPKGASSIVKQIANEFIQKYGKERLHEVAKIHFKTTNEL